MPNRSALLAAALAVLPCPVLAATVEAPLPYAVDFPEDGSVTTSGNLPPAASMTSDSLPGFAYTADQRAAWLAECQRNQMPGAIRGLAASSVAGAGADRRNGGNDANRAVVFCEDYLALYEASARTPYDRAAAADGPTADARRASRAIYRAPREQIIEEWMEEVPAAEAPEPPPASPSSKRVPLK